jgi:hypothetical protein
MIKNKIRHIVLWIILITIFISFSSPINMVESSSLVNRIQKKFKNNNISLLKSSTSIEKKFPSKTKDSSITVKFNNYYLSGNMKTNFSNFYENDETNKDYDYIPFISMEGTYTEYDKNLSMKEFLPDLTNLYFESNSNSPENSNNNSNFSTFSLLDELKETRGEMIAKLNTSDFIGDADLFKKENISKYIVKKGENLLSISKKLDISYRTLKKLNNIDSPFIDSGKAISVPKLKKVKKFATKKIMKMYIKKKNSRGGLVWPVHARRISSRFGVQCCMEPLGCRL